jgi:hypothetical protein
MIRREQAGYRDGISAGKEAALQEGFDTGFARTGAPRGRELGVLRGLAAALLLHLTRSSPKSAVNLAQTQAQARVREIVKKLAAVRFADLVSLDEEATALHEADANALCGASGSGSVNEVQGQSPSTDDLCTLRTQLEALLLEAGLNVPNPLVSHSVSKSGEKLECLLPFEQPLETNTMQ